MQCRIYVNHSTFVPTIYVCVLLIQHSIEKHYFKNQSCMQTMFQEAPEICLVMSLSVSLIPTLTLAA